MSSPPETVPTEGDHGGGRGGRAGRCQHHRRRSPGRVRQAAAHAVRQRHLPGRGRTGPAHRPQRRGRSRGLRAGWWQPGVHRPGEPDEDSADIPPARSPPTWCSPAPTRWRSVPPTSTWPRASTRSCTPGAAPRTTTQARRPDDQRHALRAFRRAGCLLWLATVRSSATSTGMQHLDRAAGQDIRGRRLPGQRGGRCPAAAGS